jgi:large subunit ribosomal protein L22
VANAEQKKVGDLDALKVTKAFVNQGVTMKRMRARAMGRGNTIRKRTSHITVVLSA